MFGRDFHQFYQIICLIIEGTIIENHEYLIIGKFQSNQSDFEQQTEK